MRGQLNTEAIELCHATNCSSFRSLSPFVGAVSGAVAIASSGSGAQHIYLVLLRS